MRKAWQPVRKARATAAVSRRGAAAWRRPAMDARLNENQALSMRAGAGPVVAEATAAERAAFITKTYAHLFGAVLAFVALEVVWFTTPVANAMLSLLNIGQFAWPPILAAFIG